MISETDYEGWVAWVDGNPIFEHVEYNPKLLPLFDDANALEYRGKSRNTLDWKDLPHDRITRVELYFARERYANQPVWRADREPGLNMRFIQMKMGSIVVATDMVNQIVGQKRTGAVGYKIGFWVPDRKECQLWEITRTDLKHLGNVSNPCAPAPNGFGLSPSVVGKI